MLFLIAPAWWSCAFLALSVIPFGSWWWRRPQHRLFYLVAIASLSTVGVIITGWASNNK